MLSGITKLFKGKLEAEEGFNRWWIVLASLGIHLCIGSIYAWSLFNPILLKRVGVVVSSADDWALKDVVWVFTVAIVFLGAAAALGGKWVERVGPRVVGMIAALCWGGGFVISGIGIELGQLWLLYVGIGIIGGCGLGLGYVSPVSTLIKWFPDRRGMASGMAIMGFGGGAIITKFMVDFLLGCYHKLPEYLGTINSLPLVTESGRRMVETADGLRNVVVVGKNEVAHMIVKGAEGIYQLGTGDSGGAGLFFTLGLIYLLVMMASALLYRLPPKNWAPQNNIPSKMVSQNVVHIDQTLKTPQFYLLWVLLCLNVTAGIGVLSVAKTMMSEIFGPLFPSIVDMKFTATYVLMISIFNMLGRFFWASISDHIGRKSTYALFFGLGTLLYLSIPLAANQASASLAMVWLVYFYAVTMAIFTMYGGGFATLPAYTADLFGSKYMGGIYGRLLTAWSVAGVIGPLAITTLRENAMVDAIKNLAGQVSPEVFEQTFGASVSQLNELIAGRTVTIAKLMELVPEGVSDPSATLYNSTMYLMALLLFVALIANFYIKPVDAKYHAPDSL